MTVFKWLVVAFLAGAAVMAALGAKDMKRYLEMRQMMTGA
jgi:hypothetical protein